MVHFLYKLSLKPSIDNTAFIFRHAKTKHPAMFKETVQESWAVPPKSVLLLRAEELHR